MNEDVVIKVENVSKDFVLPHERVSSVKGLFTSLYKKKNKTVETQHALKDINFQIKKGEFFGIVGRNGSGKSTLLKILAGIYQPSQGSITTTGKLVPFIELGVGFNPELSGRENVYLNGAMLGFSDKEVSAMYDDVVSFAELENFMDQKLKNYSSGMQVRLAFSMATRSEADILLVDEVLAVGDADFQRKCFDYFRMIKKAQKTVIFVTHDMNAIREYCDKALLLNESEVQMQGSPEVIAQEYSKLFMDSDEAQKNALKKEDRWGSMKAMLEEVAITQTKEHIIISTKVVAKVNLDKVIYGIHFFSDDGKELTATNNRMISAQDIADVKAGEKVELTWKVLNIFNDGGYTVTTTLVDSNGDVYDWYNEAASFRVKRMDRSTTPIIPPIEVKLVRKRSGDKHGS